LYFNLLFGKPNPENQENQTGKPNKGNQHGKPDTRETKPCSIHRQSDKIRPCLIEGV